MKQTTLLLTALLLLTHCATTKKSIVTNPEYSHADTTQTIVLKPAEATSILSEPNQLTNHKWMLIKAQDFNIDTIDYHSNFPYLLFDTEKNSVSGYSGCNQFGANCTLGSNQLAISTLFSTKKFCINIPETEFFQSLEKVNGFEINQDTLKLLHQKNTLLTFISKN